MKTFILIIFTLILSITMVGCGGPSKDDFKELIALNYNLADIRIDNIEKTGTGWTRLTGTAKVRDPTYTGVNLAEFCKTTKRAVTRARNKRLLKGIGIIEPGSVKAGTAIDFIIKMFPDKAKPDAKPEEVTSGGWTNGAWWDDFKHKGNRMRPFYMTKARLSKNLRIIEKESAEAQALCEKIKSLE